MSYDLMVFKAAAAPRSKPAFLDWYRIQTGWNEEHGYNNPDVTTPELRSWMLEMIQTFPAMNGPYAQAGEADGEHTADYNIGREIIYVTFAWSDAREAYANTRALALKHGVGFFNVSADDGEVVFPE